MSGPITRQVLEDFIQCKYKAFLRLSGKSGAKSSYEELNNECRSRLRQKAIQILLTKYSELETPRGLQVTPDVLKSSASLLLEGTIECDEFSVQVDGLIRRASSSHHLPVLFDVAGQPEKVQRSMLELQGLILATLQGKAPEWGVWMKGPSCDIRKIKLRGGAEARRSLQELRELSGSGKPPRLMLNSHCQVCEFQSRCHSEATAKDDLSLLRGMGPKEVLKYGRRGIFTVTQLSYTFRPGRYCRQSEARKPPHQHALQALAIRDKKVYVLGTPELIDSTVRIYFDVEGDPERNLGYLLGMIVESGQTEERFSLWADSEADEARIFFDFLHIVERYPDARLFCYGSYEGAFLRKLAMSQDCEALVAGLLARTVNVLSIIYSHVYFPVYHNGLKDIAKQLGFRWTDAEASGIQSIVWRRQWEETLSSNIKDKLITYNMEDCAALRSVKQFLYAISTGASIPSLNDSSDQQIGEAVVARAENLAIRSSRRHWGVAIFALPDFEIVNSYAYFDYQREKVFVRTNKTIRRNQKQQRKKIGRKNLRINAKMEMSTQTCPYCSGANVRLRPDKRLARLGYDLRITGTGVRRWVIQFSTQWHHCVDCKKRFLPGDYLRLAEHFHSLKAWAMFEHVAHRTTLANVADSIRQCYGLPVHTPDVHRFKKALALYYAQTYKRILEKIVSGRLIHADETEIQLRDSGKGYVWVFTSLEEVFFIFKPTREGGFLHELLKGFSGVLVSDFYTAYDSLECPQQKCLVHLIRDFNEDIRANAWDEELKSLAGAFGALLREIVGTVDVHGLKQKHLIKHKRHVEKFYRDLEGATYRSDMAEGFRKRLLKARCRLFTFLEYDSVPWNNNNAEHAIKLFANYRQYAEGLIVQSGLNEYLVLLSIYATCKYKGISFLRFLCSRELDIDIFAQSGNRHTGLPLPEFHAAECESGRWSRERMAKRARQGEV